jgi:hypothetical protein
MRAGGRRGRAVVAAVVMQSWSAGTALAQMPPGAAAPDAAPPPDSTPMVDVTIIAGGDDTDPLLGSIRELLGRLGLGVEAHGVAVPPGPVGPGDRLAVWIDLGSRFEAVTVVRRGRTEVRRTIPRDSSPAIVREEIGEAVRSGVEAQLHAEAASNPPPPPPPPVAAPLPPAPPVLVPERPPPPASPGWFALDLTVLAGGGPVATGSGPVARVGGGVVFGSRRRLRPSLAVTAAYFVPFDTVSDVKVHTSVVSLRAVPSIEVVQAPRVGIDVGVGGGVDIVSVSSSPGDDPAMPVAHVPDSVDPILTALATAYLELAPSVAFTLVLGTDFDFDRPRYFVAAPGGDGDVLVPWRARPFAMVGFTFTAVGGELFAARTP